MGGAASDEGGVDRLRTLATRLTARIGGFPAVRTLLATFDTYDRAGGGLVAGGLAYTSLLALLPGLLLLLSAVGLWITDPAQRDRIMDLIGDAVPPVKELVELAFEQVSKGAVPSGIIGIVGLLWGSSRLYSALDKAFTRVFSGARPRNEVERTVRGVVVTIVIVALPLLALLLGSIAGWLLDLAPGLADITGPTRALLQLATPLGSLVLFVGGTILVYRFVPGEAPPAAAFLPPAVLVGIALALFAQVFTFIGPRLAGIASVYGTFVALFALLAWLSISFNLLLLGASWTHVRAVEAGSEALDVEHDAPVGKDAGATGADDRDGSPGRG